MANFTMYGKLFSNKPKFILCTSMVFANKALRFYHPKWLSLSRVLRTERLFHIINRYCGNMRNSVYTLGCGYF